MDASPNLINPDRRLRLPLFALFCLVSSVFASACTPDINYGTDDDGKSTGGSRPGDGDGDGDSETGGNGNGSTPGDGDGDMGGGENTGGSGNGGDGDGDGDMGGGAPLNHCDNRVQDEDESDKDCGGMECEPCRNGRDCQYDGDCQVDSCVESICQAPSCTDSEKNGNESDFNCGGDCPGCELGEVCTEGADCRTLSCESRVCVEATCFDNIHNGDETDRDCGGSCERLCEPGQMCDFRANCVQPPLEDPSQAICEGNLCTLQCQDGLGNCDQSAATGCETNINTTMEHCGACQAACNLPNTVADKCEAGSCAIDIEAGGCSPGFIDVNGLPGDGCEVDQLTDPEHCGGQGKVCSSENGTASCVSGECFIDCDTGFEDCDNEAGSNGCEVDTTSNIDHCGGCGTDCARISGESAACDGTTDPETPVCLSILCDQASDCGGETPCGACDADQVCDDVLKDSSNCGGCGITCGAQNATTSCNSSGLDTFACAVAECVDSGGADFEDCNSVYQDGCETDVNSDVNHCGACSGTPQSKNCDDLKEESDLNIAAVQCSDGGCEVTGCNAGFADCDGVVDNGCEVNIASDGARCGGCLPSDSNSGGGVVCNAQWPDALGACFNSVCIWDGCVSNIAGDCDGFQDGCETALTDENNCGGCDIECKTSSTTTSANTCDFDGSSGGCNPTCKYSYDNCDGNGANGCEASLNDEKTCGSCTTDCTAAVGTGRVSSVACANPTGLDNNYCDITSCDAGWGDCDGEFASSCETNTTSDLEHCGGCNDADGTDCGALIGEYQIDTMECGNSSCAIKFCATDYEDCNGTLGDGCEINTTTNGDHCGECDNPCPIKPNADAVCNAGISCSWVCKADWYDNDEDLQTGSNGCEARAVVLVASSANASTGTGDATIEVPHSLLTPANNERMLLVAVGSMQSANESVPVSVTYTNSASPLVQVPLTLIETAKGGNIASTTLWAIYDDDLGAPGGASIVVTTGNTGWGSVFAEVLEFRGVKQDAAPTKIRTAGDCSGSEDRSVTMDVTKGSWLYGMTSTQFGSGDSNTSSVGGDFTEETVDLTISNGTSSYLRVAGGRTEELVTGNTTVWLNQTACWETNFAVVEIQAKTTP